MIIDSTMLIDLNKHNLFWTEINRSEEEEMKTKNSDLRKHIDEQILKRISIQTTSELTTTALIPIVKSESNLIMSWILELDEIQILKMVINGENGEKSKQGRTK
jgi:hypothetical protein